MDGSTRKSQWYCNHALSCRVDHRCQSSKTEKTLYHDLVAAEFETKTEYVKLDFNALARMLKY